MGEVLAKSHKAKFMGAVLCLCLTLKGTALAGTEPEVKALGAVLMEAESGRVLWEKNAEAPLPNASTTKIMTCLIALESGMLDDTVTVSPNAASKPETRMGLSAGEKIKLRDLLYPMMLESANDAAVAVAEHIAGSEEEFCDMMDERALEIGAMDTDFETANGLDRGGHHSTAMDMARITAYALENEDFREIISAPSATVKSDRRTYTVANKDRLLKEYDGAIGVKTGFTGLAGQCFVGAAKRDGMTLISVVLGSGWGSSGKERKWIDTKNLLNYGFENFELYTLAEAGDFASEVSVKGAYEDNVVTKISKKVVMPLTVEERMGIKTKINVPMEINAPIEKGQTVGELSFLSEDGEILAKTDIIAAGDAAEKDFKSTALLLIKHWINR